MWLSSLPVSVNGTCRPWLTLYRAHPDYNSNSSNNPEWFGTASTSGDLGQCLFLPAVKGSPRCKAVVLTEQNTLIKGRLLSRLGGCGSGPHKGDRKRLWGRVVLHHIKTPTCLSTR
jgi:hypothetical protein